MLPVAEIGAQPAPRRVDIHHHFGSPEWIKMTADKRTQGYEVCQKYSPVRSIEDMDKGNVETSYISITMPGIWFGDFAETRRVARRENEYGAKLASDYKGRLNKNGSETNCFSITSPCCDAAASGVTR